MTNHASQALAPARIGVTVRRREAAGAKNLACAGNGKPAPRTSAGCKHGDEKQTTGDRAQRLLSFFIAE